MTNREVVSVALLVALIGTFILAIGSTQAPQLPAVQEAQAKTVPEPCELESVHCEGEDPVSIIDVSRGTLRQVTAYTSHVAQTDSTPCIGATGANLCHLFLDDKMSICAANFVPLGTSLYVDGYGECVVIDRMNKRHGQRVDIYMGYDIEKALNWGIKTKNVWVIKDSTQEHGQVK